MPKPKKIVDAKKNSDGNITHVKIEGNQRFTPIHKAVGMADNGKLSNAHAVHKKNGSSHLRTNPDSKTKNNLDTMADS